MIVRKIVMFLAIAVIAVTVASATPAAACWNVIDSWSDGHVMEELVDRDCDWSADIIQRYVWNGYRWVATGWRWAR
jgi:hypothetical protein